MNVDPTFLGYSYPDTSQYSLTDLRPRQEICVGNAMVRLARLLLQTRPYCCCRHGRTAAASAAAAAAATVAAAAPPPPPPPPPPPSPRPLGDTANCTQLSGPNRRRVVHVHPPGRWKEPTSKAGVTTASRRSRPSTRRSLHTQSTQQIWTDIKASWPQSPRVVVAEMPAPTIIVHAENMDCHTAIWP